MLKNRNSEIIKTVLKLGLGLGLVFYVLRSHMVDFKTLGVVLFNPVNLLVTLIFLGFSMTCCSARWFLLARAQQLSLSFKDMFELTMIGAFFNTFMPGAVGGDLIKAWYVAGQVPQRKTKAIFTVLLDRVIGLSVFFFYAAVTLLFYTQWLAGHQELQALAIFIWVFTGASIVTGLLFFTPILWQWKVTHFIIDQMKKIEKLGQLLEATLLYRNHLVTICLSLVLSACSILATTFLYSVQGRTINVGLDLGHYFFIVPIGLTVSAIPLLPGGIGVGQVAFYKLFQWTGVANPEQGATLCTLLQIYTILFNCVGAIFYLKFRRRPKESLQAPMAPLAEKRVSPSL
jgi:glycosyltransferase 2 family protein